MCCSISWNSSGGNKLYPLGPNINSPIQVSTICQVEEGASSNGGRCSSVCVATSFLSDCFSTRLGRTPVLTWGVGRVFVADPRLGIWSGHWGLGGCKSCNYDHINRKAFRTVSQCFIQFSSAQVTGLYSVTTYMKRFFSSFPVFQQSSSTAITENPVYPWRVRGQTKTRNNITYITTNRAKLCASLRLTGRKTLSANCAKNFVLSALHRERKDNEDDDNFQNTRHFGLLFAPRSNKTTNFRPAACAYS